MNAPPPGDRWWLTAIYAALAAFAVTALTLWLPLWWGTLPLIAAAITFILVLLHNPRYWLRRLAGASLGAAALSALAPSINAAIQIAPGRFGTFIIDNSEAITISLIIAAILFAVLEVWNSRPPNGGIDPETFKKIIDRYDADIRDRDHRLGDLETENKSLKSNLSNALSRASSEAKAGDPAAKAAIADARATGDITKLQSVLIAEANRREKEVRDGAQDYLELCREIAGIAYLRGDIREAEQRLNTVINFASDDLDAHNRMGHIRQRRGELNAARESYRHVLDNATNDGWRAIAYGNLGIIAKTHGDLDEAEQLHRKSLEIDEKLGNLEGMASDYGNLGNVAKSRDELDEAERLYRMALEINEELGRLEGKAIQYSNLGIVAQTRGDVAGAREHWTKARDMFTRVGMPHKAAKVEAFLSDLPSDGDPRAT